MDSSGLASSISLAAALLVWFYVSATEHFFGRSDKEAHNFHQNSRLSFAYCTIKYASLIAVVISCQALLVSQDATGIPIQAGATIGLLASVLAIDRLADASSRRYPQLGSTLGSPLRQILVAFVPAEKQGLVLTDHAPTSNNHSNSNGVELQEPPPVVITEEEQAKLDIRERSMIRSILKLDELTVRGVMVPRIDMVAVDANTSLPEVASKMLEYGHSRLPVFQETIDHVLGVVYSRDLLPFLVEPKPQPPLTSIIRPAYFIPESKLLDDLLRELQEKHLQMAIVVDEYGGVEGLVTLEDLLEEIVGEIEDEFSRGLEPRVVPMSTGEVVVDARVTLDYISELLDASITSDYVDTVGGLVYSSLGKMPEVGDRITIDGLNIEVVSLLGRRINKLKLSRTPNGRDDSYLT